MTPDALNIKGAPMNPEEQANFETELAALLNRYSLENGSDTPDWLLAKYLTECLLNWNNAVFARENWYGRGKKPVPLPEGL